MVINLVNSVTKYIHYVLLLAEYSNVGILLNIFIINGSCKTLYDIFPHKEEIFLSCKCTYM